LPTPVKLGADALVIRSRDFAHARGAAGLAQADITGDPRQLADLRNRSRDVRRPVAVDDQPRIVLPDQRRIERDGQEPAHTGDADVPGDVPLAFGHVDAEPADRARHDVAGVVGDQQERRRSAFIVGRNRGRLVGRQKLLRHGVWPSLTDTGNTHCGRTSLQS
jgi:hypothetical protein